MEGTTPLSDNNEEEGAATTATQPPSPPFSARQRQLISCLRSAAMRCEQTAKLLTRASKRLNEEGGDGGGRGCPWLAWLEAPSPPPSQEDLAYMEGEGGGSGGSANNNNNTGQPRGDYIDPGKKIFLSCYPTL